MILEIMDATTKYGQVFTIAIIAIFVASLVAVVSFFWGKSCSSMPTYENFQAKGNQAVSNMMAGEMMANPAGTMAEGFFAGPARGAGVPDCLRSSSDAAALYDLLNKKGQTTEEGADDLREMQLLLGKIACFKRDLTGAAGVVEATKAQPFSTSHDLEPVAETTARCFAKTIPQRDLQLSLDKWGSRGTFLIKRLCTSEMMSASEEDEAIRLFGDAMADISDIALGRCCSGPVKIAGMDGPRMVGGYESPNLVNLREYEGYY